MSTLVDPIELEGFGRETNEGAGEGRRSRTSPPDLDPPLDDTGERPSGVPSETWQRARGWSSEED